MSNFKYKWEVQGKKGIVVKVVADSISFTKNRLITFELTYPRIIHAELLTHRTLSRNAMSSRAVPIKTLIDQVVNSPAQPIEFGKNKTGMSSDGELDAFVEGYTANEWWNLAGLSASRFANAFAEAGYHKQVANRLLEPFQFMKTVVTGTEFDNFFKLRLAADVDPTMKELASCMKEAYDSSTPELLKAGEWHTPYVEHFRESDGGATLEYIVDNISVTLEEAKAISASSCAQISYRNIDNSYDKAMKIYDRLGVGTEHFHASPFEHQGTPMDMMVVDSKGFSGRNELSPLTWQQGITHVDSSYCLWSGNFKGFIQYRQLL